MAFLEPSAAAAAAAAAGPAIHGTSAGVRQEQVAGGQCLEEREGAAAVHEVEGP